MLIKNLPKGTLLLLLKINKRANIGQEQSKKEIKITHD